MDRYRRLIVQYYMADDVDAFEEARISLCQLIGKDPDDKRKRPYVPLPARRKYNPDQIRELRELYAGGMGLAELGRIYGGGDQVLRDIVKHKTYRDIQ